MIGAIIGDVSGSRYERVNHKSKEFELLDKKCRPTDDSVMSLAVAQALMDCDGDYSDLSSIAIARMQEMGKQYRNAGYGGSFIKWIMADDPQPYNSFGNGSAMRVGPCGYVASSIEEAKELSAMVTKVSHDHPEGIKGAEAVAVAVYLAKSGKDKDAIKEYILKNYYEISFTIDQIRDSYKLDVSCQGSVPVALEAFFESFDFEDAIRTAISVGGDSDTIAAITGAIAEAYYGIPEGIIGSVIDFLDSRQMEILYCFEKAFPSKALDEDGENTSSIFDVIDDYIDKLDKGKKAREFFAKTGSDITKTAKKAGKGILSAVKTVKDNVDKTRQKVAAKAVSCYAIAIEDTEDTEKTMQAVSVLLKANFEAKIYVSEGTMFGYVFLKGEDLDKAIEIMKSVDGVSLNMRPVDKVMAEMIRKH